MKKVCAFFGHSMFVECRLNKELLKNTIEKLIVDGVETFLVGSHGEFDKMCLTACCSLKEKYPNIKICKVYTNIHSLIKEENYNNKIEKISYSIENFHYKQQITKSNEMMVNSADVVVCYADFNLTNSGAVKSIKYAQKLNKKIINLFNQHTLTN